MLLKSYFKRSFLIYMISRIKYFLPVIVTLYCFSSCSNDEGTYKNITDVTRYKNNQVLFSSKYYPLLNLEKDYKCFNQDGGELSEKSFLDSLISGSYFPMLQRRKESGEVRFSLVKLIGEGYGSIIEIVKVVAYYRAEDLKVIGKDLSGIILTDVKGQRMSLDDPKYKFTIVKCWFIGCTACVAEFPELNEFVSTNFQKEKYKFISLAIDDNLKLNEFLKLHPFQYNVVGKMGDFMREKIGIVGYPTHLVIEKGKVIRTFSRAYNLINFLKSNS